MRPQRGQNEADGGMLLREAGREPETTPVNSGNRLRHGVQGMGINLSCI